MTLKYPDVVSAMSLKEKSRLCSGADMWHFKDVPRLNVPTIMVCDGPHGLRKQASGQAVNRSIDAICFPLACAVACSWDESLIFRMGEAIGLEAQAEDVAVVLGPGTNIKRNPLCGRNFEYFSEDPLLAGKLAAAWINGAQSQGVGTSLKHYCANNQETNRLSIDAIVDERALREIYLAPFEIAVKTAAPRTVMAAYNKVNGTYASQNQKILTDILREEWGYDGLVISDWGAVAERVPALKAGLDVEMPFGGGITDQQIEQAVSEGTLEESTLDRTVDRILDCIFTLNASHRAGATYDKNAHYDLARSIAAQSAVLLKNEERTLPLAKNEKILLVGEFARTPRFQGAGSSYINCSRVSSVENALKERGFDVIYRAGYTTKSDTPDSKAIEQAVAASASCDKVVICAGLPPRLEAEGFDRTNIELPDAQNRLIEALCRAHKSVTVVLSTGGVVTLPWADQAQAILCTYLGGQAGGDATADVLDGTQNPCGKLAETFPLSWNDLPSSANFPGGRKTVEYREGLYVGYRYTETAHIPVRFPFGHGLSYTRYRYSDLTLEYGNAESDLPTAVSFTLSNVGDCAGKEIAQVYVNKRNGVVYAPELQLKGFTKIALNAGESARVTVPLDDRAFAYYDPQTRQWETEQGDYCVYVGASARDLYLEETIRIGGKTDCCGLPEDSWYRNPSDRPVRDDEFAQLVADYQPTPYAVPTKGAFTKEDSFGDMAPNSGFARFILRVAKLGVRLSLHVPADDPNARMMYEVLKTSPLRALASASQGMMSQTMADGLLTMLNGKFFRGLNQLLKALSNNNKMRKKLQKETKRDRQKS